MFANDISSALEVKIVSSLVSVNMGFNILYQLGSSSAGSPEPFLALAVGLLRSFLNALYFVYTICR